MTSIYVYFVFRQLICPLDGCKQTGKSKMHTLISKARPLCLHTILALAADASGQKKETKPVEHQLNFKATVEKVVKQIKDNFPSTFRSCEEGKFLASSKTFLDVLVSSEDTSSRILQSLPTECDTCGCPLEEWKRKSPRSYLITLGKFSES
jgi:hypothetical protein